LTSKDADVTAVGAIEALPVGLSIMAVLLKAPVTTPGALNPVVEP
jgi:hypothetical protein